MAAVRFSAIGPEGALGRLFAMLLLAGCHTPKSTTPDAATADPCAKVTCEMGTHCEVRSPACDSPPCAKQAECAPDPEENPCNVLDCPAEQVCVVNEGKATCAGGSDESEDESKADAGSASATSCALALCPPKTYCDDLGGKVRCIPLPSCDEVRCEADLHCELKQVQCIRAPCPAQPSCVK